MMEDISLRAVSIGCTELNTFRLCGTDDAPSVFDNTEGAVTAASVLAKMRKEQPDMADALVLWYSPSVQGLTAEQITDNYPEFKGGLRDLSGNGFDATIFGMDEANIDAGGNLVFDGVDDYCLSDVRAVVDISNYTYFGEYDWVKPLNSTFFKSEVSPTISQHIVSHLKTQYYNFGTLVSSGTNLFSVVATEATFNGEPVAKGTKAKKFNLVRLGWYGGAATTFAQFTFKCAIFFNKTLTAEQQTWVRENMISI